MHVLSSKRLREFWQVHPDAESPLRGWYRIAKKAEWSSFPELRTAFGKRADRVGDLTVFAIGGNKYRLIAAIHYNRGKVFVQHVLTHAEYDLGKWKDD